MSVPVIPKAEPAYLVALKEFLRVLKPEGFAVITCSDLQAAARMIAEDKLMETAYNSPAGPVTPFDIVYSHRQFTGRDKPFMAITADLP